MRLQIIIITLCLYQTFALKLPKAFDICRIAPELDNKPNECLPKAIEIALKQLGASGLSEYGIPQLDPLFVEKISISQDQHRPIWINLKLSNVSVHGLSNVKINQVNGTLSSAKNFNMKLKHGADVLRIEGPYKVRGQILLIPLHGNGHTDIVIRNPTFQSTVQGEPFYKNGKEYLRFTNVKVKLVDVEKLTIYLGNLFNGNKLLEDQVNRLINDNWKDVLDEFVPFFENVFVNFIRTYSNRLFDKVEFKDLFTQ